MKARTRAALADISAVPEEEGFEERTTFVALTGASVSVAIGILFVSRHRLLPVNDNTHTTTHSFETSTGSNMSLTLGMDYL